MKLSYKVFRLVVVVAVVSTLYMLSLLPARRLRWNYPTSIDQLLSVPCNISNGPQSEFCVDLSSISILQPSFYPESRNKTLKPPAVVLRWKGGAGNQLFQYACHYAIARMHNWPLYIMLNDETSEILNRSNSDSRDVQVRDRKFVLDLFNIPLGKWNMLDRTWKLSEVHVLNDSQILSGSYSHTGQNIIQHSGLDYCQSENYFSAYKYELRELFQLRSLISDQKSYWEDLVNLYEGKETVAVHVRLGDFIRVNQSAPLSFFEEAMSLMKHLVGSDLKFYVFSDEIDKAKSQFEEFDIVRDRDIVFVKDSALTSGLQEFYLMSKCHHQIISSSTFAWWAAYLNRNPDKKVIACHYNKDFFDGIFKKDPTRRDFAKVMYRNFYYPSNWILLDSSE